MIRKKIVFVLLFCVNVSASLAQEVKTRNFFGYIPKMKISVISPMALLDPRPFAEGSFEYKTSKQNSLEFSAGVYLPYSGWQLENNGRSYAIQNSGFRLRANYKLYFSQYDYCKHRNAYVAPELIFQQFSAASTGWFSRFENVYQQYMTLNRRTTTIGAGIILGEQLYTPDQHNLFLDMYVGLGYRGVQIKQKDVAEDIDIEAHRSAFGLIARNQGSYFHPYVIVGLKMGFVLKK